MSLGHLNLIKLANMPECKGETIALYIQMTWSNVSVSEEL